MNVKIEEIIHMLSLSCLAIAANKFMSTCIKVGYH